MEASGIVGKISVYMTTVSFPDNSISVYRVNNNRQASIRPSIRRLVIRPAALAVSSKTHCSFAHAVEADMADISRRSENIADRAIARSCGA
jgi:hypothetical protein